MAEFDSTQTPHLFLGTADLWPQAATASHPGHWATAHVNDDPALRWIVAKYVEGGSPNRNNHMWAPEDLEASIASVPNSPINMLHKSHYVVGSVTGAKYMKKDEKDKKKAKAEDMNPFVEVVGPLWRYYFPNEVATVEAAFNEGALFVSMECIAETARWHAASGETRDFPYKGPNHESYGEWQAQGNVLQFVNPHFLGCGLIVPPVKPGWGGAVVHQIAQLVDEHEDQAEDIYSTVARIAPHLSPSIWEEVMLSVLVRHHDTEVL